MGGKNDANALKNRRSGEKTITDHFSVNNQKNLRSTTNNLKNVSDSQKLITIAEKLDALTTEISHMKNELLNINSKIREVVDEEFKKKKSAGQLLIKIQIADLMPLNVKKKQEKKTIKRTILLLGDFSLLLTPSKMISLTFLKRAWEFTLL